jgi:hypothetical protein
MLQGGLVSSPNDLLVYGKKRVSSGRKRAYGLEKGTSRIRKKIGRQALWTKNGRFADVF